MNVDTSKMLSCLSHSIQIKRRSISDKVQAQIEHLGYVDIADERYNRMAAVLDVDTKYSPKIKLYSLKNGTTLDCKIDKRTFNKLRLKKGDILTILSCNYKPKVKRNENGEWENVPNTKELWITKYTINNNI